MAKRREQLPDRTLTADEMEAWTEEVLEGPRLGKVGRKVAREYPWLSDRQQQTRAEHESVGLTAESARRRTDGSFRLPRSRQRPRPPKN